MTKATAQRTARQQGGTMRSIPGVFRRATGWWIRLNYVIDLADGSVVV